MKLQEVYFSSKLLVTLYSHVKYFVLMYNNAFYKIQN